MNRAKNKHWCSFNAIKSKIYKSIPVIFLFSVAFAQWILCVHHSTTKSCVCFHFVELLLCLQNVVHDKTQTTRAKWRKPKNWRQIWFAWKHRLFTLCDRLRFDDARSSAILGMHKTVIFHINNRQQKQSNHDSCVSRAAVERERAKKKNIEPTMPMAFFFRGQNTKSHVSTNRFTCLAAGKPLHANNTRYSFCHSFAPHWKL